MFNLQELIKILERTPKVVQALLDRIPSSFIHENEGEGTWSPFDVVGHLIHGENTDWISRLRIILSEQENKTFDSFDRFAMIKGNENKTIVQLLDEFVSLRKKNLRELKEFNLQKHHFLLEGKHPHLGTVNLQQLLATWVVHDLGHITQISRTIARHYLDEVGPWKQFLNVLDAK